MIYGVKNKKIVLLCFILIGSTLLASGLQFVKGNLFQNAIDSNWPLLTSGLLIMGMMILGEVLLYFIEWTFENVIIRKTLADKKKKVIESALSVKKFDTSNEEMENKMNLLTNTIDRLEYSYYTAAFDSLYLVFRIVFVTISLAYINVLVGLLMLVLMFVPVVVSKLFKDKLAELEDKFINSQGDNLSFYKNVFDNIKNVRILNARKLFMSKAFKKIEDEQDAGQASKQKQLFLNSFYSLYSYTVHFLVLGLSIYLLYTGKIAAGMIITLLGLTEQLSMPILSLSRNINSINSTKTLRENIENGSIIDLLDDESIVMKKNLHLEEVIVEIGDKELKYQNLLFEKGKKYLIEGESGTGKSVLMDVITGLKKIKSGSVFCDNVVAEDKNMFQDIAYIPTNLDLFHGNGIFNILLTEEYTSKQVNYLKQFIGENKLFSDDMTKLSAGERRRILNLRGLMSDKSVVIFDEPTSNLDDKNSKLFWDEIKKSYKTVIIVSHDVPKSERNLFDECIVLNDYCKLIEISA